MSDDTPRQVPGEDWVKAFADALGAESPSREEIGAILKLAAIAAHASERTAAPVACWIAGRDGRPLSELQEIAERVSAGE